MVTVELGDAVLYDSREKLLGVLRAEGLDVSRVIRTQRLPASQKLIVTGHLRPEYDTSEAD